MYFSPVRMICVDGVEMSATDANNDPGESQRHSLDSAVSNADPNRLSVDDPRLRADDDASKDDSNNSGAYSERRYL